MDIFVQCADFDCGVACIGMIAAHHGLRFDAAGRSGHHSAQRRSFPMARLMAIARELGMEPKVRRAEITTLSGLATPCALNWDHHHFVVLTSVSDDHATILDPARGRCRLGIQELLVHSMGIALELLPRSEAGTTKAVPRLSIGHLPYCSTCGWVEGPLADGMRGQCAVGVGALRSDAGSEKHDLKGASDVGRSSQAPSVPGPPGRSKSARLEVRGLGFRYAPDGPWVLKDCSFTVEEGESIAIVGAPGSGKSTLAKLLLGLLPSTEGSIALDGWAMHRFSPNHYRRVVAGVMENGELVPGSVAENIAQADCPLDLERVAEVARLAGVHEEITAMPLGYHTPVVESHTAFPGAQRQRLMLARALYMQPRILVVDGTAGLWDGAFGDGISEHIHAFQLTRVTTAERPNLVAHADRVLILDGGRISRELRLPGAALSSVRAMEGAGAD